MAILTQTAAYNRAFLLVQSSDHLTGLTGASGIVVQGAKNGGSFTTLTAVISELGNGYYNAALKTSDTSVLGDLAFHVTATSADPTDFVDQVVAGVPANVTQWSASTVSVLPANFTNLSVDSNGAVATKSNIKKNAALNNFTFVMTNTSSTPLTGATVTGSRSLDGAAFAACANSVAELASGFYSINLAASDLNANVVALKFTASGANDQDITIVTTP